VIKKSKNYEMFIFRDDNREKIDQTHVRKLMHSIEMRNLLEFRPIVVNEKMEVIDGQHRLLAAKALGIEIYYEIQKNIEITDIIPLNVAKNWTFSDYLNFYVKNKNEHYVKLKEIMTTYNLSIKIALRICSNDNIETLHSNFRSGNFVFQDKNIEHDMNLAWDTVNCIRRFNGYSPYALSGRFWLSMLKLFKHPDFSEKRWRTNMEILVSKFGPKSNIKAFDEMFLEIYNYRNSSKLDFENIMENAKEQEPVTRQEKIKTMVAKARQTSLFEEIKYK